jgi:ABC-2 type transport system permease protein
MWRRILALMVKEMLAVLQDPKSRFVLFGPPIIQLIVFGYAASFDLKNVPFAVYNEDASQPSRDLVARFAGSPSFQEVARIHSDAETAALIDPGKVLMVLHIDRRFSRDLLSGRPGRVQIIVDGRNSNTALILAGYANTIITAFSMQWIADHGGKDPPAVLDVRSWFNPNLDSRWFIVPGIVALLTQVVTLVLTAL